MIKRGCLAVSMFLILVLTILGNAESPYSVDFDLRNMAGFNDNTITAEDIVAYIQEKYPDSPMLVEEGIGDCFISAGQNNNVNPAFLVATAELEGRFGTAGWAANNLDCHNTMGYDISDSGPGEYSCVDSWCAMIERVASAIAVGRYHYKQNMFTVCQIRGDCRPEELKVSQYATDSNSIGIVKYMDELYIFSINRKPNGLDAGTWSKFIGGTGWSFQQTNDGGYIVTGEIDESRYGSQGILLIKTDANGDKIWEKKFGRGDGRSVQQTSDGGYIIVGRNRSGYSPCACLIKTDANGNKIWEKNLDKYVFGSIGYSVQQTTDGGYIAAGEHASLIKTDANGEEIWSKDFYRYNDDGNIVLQGVLYSISQTVDGSYVITGYHRSANESGTRLIKIDSLGNEQWDRTFFDGGTGRSVQQTVDGGYIITGAGTVPGFEVICLIKTDANGNKIWEKKFGHGKGRSVQQTSDGGYIIVGENTTITYSFPRACLIKTDSDGNKIWERTLNGLYGTPDTPTWEESAGHAVRQTDDGGYIIICLNGWLIKTDADGRTVSDGENGPTNLESPDIQDLPTTTREEESEETSTNAEDTPTDAPKESPLPISLSAMSLIAAGLFMKSKWCRL